LKEEQAYFHGETGKAVKGEDAIRGRGTQVIAGNVEHSKRVVMIAPSEPKPYGQIWNKHPKIAAQSVMPNGWHSV
jgi:hypothetical protein